jgi:hypothetical protein
MSGFVWAISLHTRRCFADMNRHGIKFPHALSLPDRSSGRTQNADRARLARPGPAGGRQRGGRVVGAGLSQRARRRQFRVEWIQTVLQAMTRLALPGIESSYAGPGLARIERLPELPRH